MKKLLLGHCSYSLAWLKMHDLHAKRKKNDFVTVLRQDELIRTMLKN